VSSLCYIKLIKPAVGFVTAALLLFQKFYEPAMLWSLVAITLS